MFSLSNATEHKTRTFIHKNIKSNTPRGVLLQDKYAFFYHNKLHRIDGPAQVVFHDGNILSESWFYMGILHRIDGPAYIQYSKTGKILFEKWYFIGKLHSFTGPAVVYYLNNGSIFSEWWFVHGLEHNSTGPARIIYFENGFIEQKEYFVDGLRYVPLIVDHLKQSKHITHPTEIRYFNSGQLQEERWYIGGYADLCREDGGPARILYYDFGTSQCPDHKRLEEWYDNKNELIQQVFYDLI